MRSKPGQILAPRGDLEAVANRLRLRMGPFGYRVVRLGPPPSLGFGSRQFGVAQLLSQKIRLL